MAIPRMTHTTRLVLNDLHTHRKPRYGLQILEATGILSGTLYPILARLEQAGLIVGVWEDGTPTDRPRRRYYQLTDAGREFAASRLNRKGTR